MLKHLLIIKSLILIFFYTSAFTLITSSKTQAIEVTNLYQATVAFDSQTAQSKALALKSAMKVVLVKVGGNKSVLSNKIIKKAIKNYKFYLSQFRYQNKKQLLSLVASFNENKINSLFKKTNLPIWGTLRPQVLLWLINEHQYKRSVVSNSSPSVLPTIVNDFSDGRGLPILLPLMDLTDAANINLSDLWGRFAKPVREISQRYFPETIVIMRLSDSSLLPELADNVDCKPLCQQNYVLDWSLITQSQQFSRQYQGIDRGLLLQEGLNDIAEVIYQKYALSTSLTNELTIEVANIDNMTVYMQLIDFLTNLSSVETVKLVSANGTSRRFNLGLIGAQSALMASLKLNKLLTQHIDPLAVVDVDAIPIFYWRAK